jgi:hypothetical protein
MSETDTEQEDAHWPWSQLGLEPTAQIREIRVAYARALKKIDQQQDVAGFQALREARDEALLLATELANEFANEKGEDSGPASGPPPVARSDPEPREQELGGEAGVAKNAGAQNAGVAETVFQPLTVLLRNQQARSSLSNWARMLDERPLMSDRQAYAFERCVVLALDSWLDSDVLPSHEVFLVLDNTFGWSAAGSNLPEFLPRLRERRLRTIISSLRV